MPPRTRPAGNNAAGRASSTEGTRFHSAPAFRAWLRKHHRTARALVVTLAKTHVSRCGLTYAEALDEALCVGWIDGLRRRIDEDTYSIRFTPRKPRSIWSRVNVAHVLRLIASGRMTRAGLRVYEARTEARTGIYSFEQAEIQLAPAVARRFKAERSAWAYYQAEAPWYRQTSTFWVMSAKREETRARRLETLIRSSAAGQRIPSLSASGTGPRLPQSRTG